MFYSKPLIRLTNSGVSRSVGPRVGLGFRTQLRFTDAQRTGNWWESQQETPIPLVTTNVYPTACMRLLRTLNLLPYPCTGPPNLVRTQQSDRARSLLVLVLQFREDLQRMGR